MNINLDKVKAPVVTSVATYLFGSLTSGLLFVIVFLRQYFFDLDTFKLILLSMSISTPIILVNTILVATKTDFDDSEIDENTYSYRPSFLLLSGIIFSLPVLYLTLLVGFYTGWGLLNGIILLTSLEFASAIAILASKKTKRS